MNICVCMYIYFKGYENRKESLETSAVYGRVPDHFPFNFLLDIQCPCEETSRLML